MNFHGIFTIIAAVPLATAKAFDNGCLGKGLAWIPDLVSSNISLQNAFASLCRPLRGDYTVPALDIPRHCETVYGGEGWMNSLEIEIQIANQVNNPVIDHFNVVYFSMQDCMTLLNSLPHICKDAALVMHHGITVGPAADGGDHLNITGWLASAPGDCFQAHALPRN